MNNEQLAELERLHAAATPGPWRRSKQPYKSGTCKQFEIEAQGRAFWVAKVLCFDRSEIDGVDPQYEANADLIPALHNAFPDLLAYVRELEGELDCVRNVSAKWLTENNAQQRREGAAAHLELMAEWSKNAHLSNEYRAEAKRLREGK